MEFMVLYLQFLVAVYNHSVHSPNNHVWSLITVSAHCDWWPNMAVQCMHTMTSDHSHMTGDHIHAFSVSKHCDCWLHTVISDYTWQL